MSIENRCVQIKAELQKLTDVKNPTARLVAVLMACGVTATSELAELVGVGERAIQKARKLLPQANQETRTTVRNEPEFANHSSPPEPQFAKNEPGFAPRVHAPAQMEYPTDINITQEVASSTPEIEGLNGSTEYFTDMLAGWLAGSMSVPDPETSHKLLVGYVNAYSPEAVKSGMVELETEIAQGRQPRDVGKAFSGFVRKAHERGSKPGNVVSLAVPDWRQEKADRIERTRKLRAEWRQEHAL